MHDASTRAMATPLSLYFARSASATTSPIAVSAAPLFAIPKSATPPSDGTTFERRVSLRACSAALAASRSAPASGLGETRERSHRSDASPQDDPAGHGAEPPHAH